MQMKLIAAIFLGGNRWDMKELALLDNYAKKNRNCFSIAVF